MELPVHTTFDEAEMCAKVEATKKGSRLPSDDSTRDEQVARSGRIDRILPLLAGRYYAGPRMNAHVLDWRAMQFPNDLREGELQRLRNTTRQIVASAYDQESFCKTAANLLQGMSLSELKTLEEAISADRSLLGDALLKAFPAVPNDGAVPEAA